MQDNIKRIAEKLRNNEYISTPHQAAEDKGILAGEFAFVMSQLEEILNRKPAKWNAMRDDFKSDTACERAWEQTEDGINENGLRLREKSIKNMMSALGTIVRINSDEAHNLS